MLGPALCLSNKEPTSVWPLLIAAVRAVPPSESIVSTLAPFSSNSSTQPSIPLYDATIKHDSPFPFMASTSAPPFINSSTRSVLPWLINQSKGGRPFSPWRFGSAPASISIKVLILFPRKTAMKRGAGRMSVCKSTTAPCFSSNAMSWASFNRAAAICRHPRPRGLKLPFSSCNINVSLGGRMLGLDPCSKRRRMIS